MVVVEKVLSAELKKRFNNEKTRKKREVKKRETVVLARLVTADVVR